MALFLSSLGWSDLMLTTFTNRFSSVCTWVTLFLALGQLLYCQATVSAQETRVYSFEPDLEGFHLNGGGLTVSQETSGIGATHGANSMKLEFADFSSFAGPATENIPAAFLDPLGIDFIRLDLTNTNRFVPPTPQPGVTPTFANAGITFFGTLPGNPVEPAQIQFFLVEQPLGNLEPGTHQIEFDLSNEGSPTHMGGGLNVDTGQIKGYDAWVSQGFVPQTFEIYLNKNGKFGDPTFAWTVYVDNIRVGRFPAGVPGDYNSNGAVDAADYVIWRNGGPLANEVADPGTVSGADYTEWKARFGNTAGSGSVMAAVPEPTGLLLLLFSAASALALRKRP
jgi:hypothetical protein